MNINLKFLLLGATLSLIPTITQAQCSQAQNCAELGYKETANKGGCLKCPFGDGWYCPKPKEEKAVLGQCTGYAKNCKIGNILNSDGTCTTDKISGKTPIAVIVYISPDGNCGQAISPTEINKNILLGGKPTGVQYGSVNELKLAALDFNSCGNTKQMIANINTTTSFPEEYTTYPATEFIQSYAPASSLATKGKWCLPAGGIFTNIYKNLATINSAIQKIGGQIFEDESAVSDHNNTHHIWSSSESDSINGIVLCTNKFYSYDLGVGFNESKFSSTNTGIRAVIEF